ILAREPSTVNCLPWSPTAPSVQAESLAPTVDQFPPYQLRPLFKIHLSPFSMSPPLHAKLPGIEGSSDAVVRRQSLLKNTERAPGVVVGSDQQDAADVDPLKAAGYVLSFVPGGASVDWTNGNRGGLRQPLDIFSCNLRLAPLVNHGLGGNIENQPRGVTLIEQFQPSCRTPVSFSGQNNDYVRLAELIHHQKSSGSANQANYK